MKAAHFTPESCSFHALKPVYFWSCSTTQQTPTRCSQTQMRSCWKACPPQSAPWSTTGGGTCTCLMPSWLRRRRCLEDHLASELSSAHPQHESLSAWVTLCMNHSQRDSLWAWVTLSMTHCEHESLSEWVWCSSLVSACDVSAFTQSIAQASCQV